MNLLRLPLAILAATLFVCPADATLLWGWSYSAPGITAQGTFATVDNPNSNGGYLITSVTGTRDSETIIALQATGTSIPGNEPFIVDNLVFLGTGPQLTKNGFGFSTSGGNYSNPFYADFLPTPGYLEFFSVPPFDAGSPGGEDTELPIQFSAAPIPEPATFPLAFTALGLFGYGVIWSRSIRPIGIRPRVVPSDTGVR